MLFFRFPVLANLLHEIFFNFLKKIETFQTIARIKLIRVILLFVFLKFYPKVQSPLHCNPQYAVHRLINYW